MTTSFADRLRSLRISTGMTLEGLAASSGVSIRAISDLERGRSARPHPRTLEALTKGMDLDEEERAWLWAALLEGAGRPDQGIPPARATSLVGRSEEIAKLARLLQGDEPSTAVISGLPGVGKSALAVEATATVLPDGHRVFVDLADFDDSPEALFAILRIALSQCVNTIPWTPSSAMDSWVRWCADHPTVVHLEDVSAEAQLRVIDAAEPRAVIATTRRRFIGAETSRVVLQPLPESESARQLRMTAPAGSVGDEELAELARLCAGLPLALRIVVDRLLAYPQMNAEDLLVRLRPETGRLAALVAGDLSVSSSINRSYRLLEEQERKAFRAIGRESSASFNAADVAVTSGLAEIETVGILDRLADLGMIEPLHDVRYRTHELVRLFAAQISEH